MNVKRFILAAIAGGAAMWTLAGIWHNLILDDLYGKKHSEHEDVMLLIVAYLVLAMFMSYLYPLFKKLENKFLNGLIFGSIIGLLWVFPHDLVMAGAHNTSVLYAIKNGLWHMVEQGLGGVIISQIYNKINNKKEK